MKIRNINFKMRQIKRNLENDIEFWKRQVDVSVTKEQKALSEGCLLMAEKYLIYFKED